MLISKVSQLSLSFFSKSSIVATLAAMGVLAGAVPNFSVTSPHLISFGNVAFAKDFSSAEVTNYARIVMQMEPIRQAVFRDIETIIGSKPSAIPCYQSRALNALPRDARELAVNYCGRYKELIESNPVINITSFNAITRQAQSDPDLKRRIQNAMIEIQRQ